MMEMDWEAQWQRMWHRTATAVVAGAAVSSITAVATNRPVMSTTLAVATNCGAAMAVFSVLQEGVRAARGGSNDAWNSVAAGSLAGTALVGLHAGGRYRALGALTWGPICGAAHLVLAAVQPGELFQAMLVSGGLLDAPPPTSSSSSSSSSSSRDGSSTASSSNGSREHDGSHGLPAEAAVPLPVPRTVESLTQREKVVMVKELRDRELAALRKAMEGGSKHDRGSGNKDRAEVAGAAEDGSKRQWRQEQQEQQHKQQQQEDQQSGVDAGAAPAAAAAARRPTWGWWTPWHKGQDKSTEH